MNASINVEGARWPFPGEQAVLAGEELNRLSATPRPVGPAVALAVPHLAGARLVPQFLAGNTLVRHTRRLGTRVRA